MWPNDVWPPFTLHDYVTNITDVFYLNITPLGAATEKPKVSEWAPVNHEIHSPSLRKAQIRKCSAWLMSPVSHALPEY